MKILNFGSLNIDMTYTMDHFVRPGETQAALKLESFCGGKGLNQSIAAAQAGATVYHAGKVGPDGAMLTDRLAEGGVNTQYISYSSGPSGHAIIQVDSSGQNCIILYGGANQEITPDDVDEVLRNFDEGDLLLLQNEISCLPYLLRRAAEKGMVIALNPSPISPDLVATDLSMVQYFLLNELEGRELTGAQEPEAICQALLQKYPGCRVVLTLGERGAVYTDGKETCSHGIYKVNVVDTTAAGDTFTGYFLACITEGMAPETALEKASKASGLAVSRPGASDSIPTRAEVDTTAIKLA